MTEDSPERSYYDILKSYAESGEEQFLLESEQLGARLLKNEVPPEEIGEIHEDAIALLAQEYPDLTLKEAAGLVSAPLMELLLSYGLAFRERAERQRLEAEERQRLYTAIEQSGETVFITDRYGTILFVNDAFTQVSGYARHEAIGRKPSILKSGRHTGDFYHDLWETLKSGHVWTGEFINRKKDGTVFYEKATISPVRDTTGEILNYVAVKRDVTKERELEEQLRNAHKMEAIGRLAGGVAHEFNNLLTSVIANVGLLQMDLAESNTASEHIEEIQRIISRTADVTGHLLTFGRKSVVKPRLLDLRVLLDGASRLFRHVLEDSISLTIKYDENLAPVQVDPRQLEQVVINMIINSREAMPEGGEVRVTLENVELGDDYVATHPQVSPGAYVRMSVADTGHGMDEETRSHLFEPFYTTKRERSSGLGLAIAYGAIIQNHGHIECFSTPGQGTRFDVYLPAAETAPDEARRAPAPPPVFGGTETILFVEDEESILTSTKLLLERKGYEVIGISSAEEGLKIFEGRAVPPDLLLTDIVLPEMNGCELAEKLQAMCPELKVVYSSGYIDSIVGQEGMLPPGTTFLAKPYSINDLFETIRTKLDE